ncbi:MAG: hypothetical protein JF590_03435 [Gemmatimonadetes bacterium]|nr:hypothetical protein [Gemmatimonadota bacterium]
MKRLIPLSFFVVAAVLGCDDQVTWPGHTQLDGHSIAIDAGDPGADGILHGFVVGVDTAGGGGSGSRSYADIPVEIYQLVPAPGSVVGDSVPYVPELRGTVTTDADGHFTVTSIPIGEYVVYAKPPAGSYWAASQGWGFTTGSDWEREAAIYLYPKSVVGG